MSPDVYPSAGTYQDPGNERLEPRDIHRQQQQTERQHPEAEKRQDGQKTPQDQGQGERDPDPSQPPVEKRVHHPSRRRHMTGQSVELPVQSLLFISHFVPCKILNAFQTERHL